MTIRRGQGCHGHSIGNDDRFGAAQPPARDPPARSTAGRQQPRLRRHHVCRHGDVRTYRRRCARGGRRRQQRAATAIADRRRHDDGARSARRPRLRRRSRHGRGSLHAPGALDRACDVRAARGRCAVPPRRIYTAVGTAPSIIPTATAYTQAICCGGSGDVRAAGAHVYERRTRPHAHDHADDGAGAAGERAAQLGVHVRTLGCAGARRRWRRCRERDHDVARARLHDPADEAPVVRAISPVCRIRVAERNQTPRDPAPRAAVHGLAGDRGLALHRCHADGERIRTNTGKDGSTGTRSANGSRSLSSEPNSAARCLRIST